MGTSLFLQMTFHITRKQFVNLQFTFELLIITHEFPPSQQEQVAYDNRMTFSRAQKLQKLALHLDFPTFHQNTSI